MALEEGLIVICKSRLFRFCIIGILCNLIFYLLYLLLTYKHIDPKKAMTFVYVVAATFSFFVNKRFTFFYNGNILSSGTRYAIAHTFGYLLNWFILNTFVVKLKYPHQIVQGVAIFVVAAFLFVVFNLFVFKEK